MKYSVLLAALLAVSMTACGQKEEAAAPVEAPAAEAPAAEVAPMEAAPMEAAPMGIVPCVMPSTWRLLGIPFASVLAAH